MQGLTEDKVILLKDIDVLNNLVIGYDADPPKQEKSDRNALGRVLMESIFAQEIE